MKKKRKRTGSTGTVSVILILAAFMAVMGVQIYRLKQKDDTYAVREQELLQESQAEEQRSSELDELEDTVKSSEYVESVARTKLGLTKDPDNEIIFKEREGK